MLGGNTERTALEMIKDVNQKPSSTSLLEKSRREKSAMELLYRREQIQRTNSDARVMNKRHGRYAAAPAPVISVATANDRSSASLNIRPAYRHR